MLLIDFSFQGLCLVSLGTLAAQSSKAYDLDLQIDI